MSSQEFVDKAKDIANEIDKFMDTKGLTQQQKYAIVLYLMSNMTFKVLAGVS